MKLKKIIIGIFVLCMTASVSASDIGKIDMQVLFSNLKKIAKFNENMASKQEEYQKLLERKEKEITEAREKNKSMDQIQVLMTKAEEELLPKQQELMELQRAFEKNLRFEIDSASNKIAEEYQLKLIVNSEVLFFGGFDITNLIIERLNEF